MTEELNNRLTPLTQKIDKVQGTVRSLFRNGDGGAPGYLETARAEDNGRFETLFKMLEKLRPLEDFVTGFRATEIQREKDRIARDAEIAKKLDESAGRLNAKIAIAGVIVAILALLVGWLTYRDSQRKLSDAHQPAVSSSQIPPAHSAVE